LWIIANPPWHTDAVGGRSHHQRRLGVGLKEISIGVVDTVGVVVVRGCFPFYQFGVELDLLGEHDPESMLGRPEPSVPITQTRRRPCWSFPWITIQMSRSRAFSTIYGVELGFTFIIWS
jgi:hypothetical protein